MQTFLLNLQLLNPHSDFDFEKDAITAVNAHHGGAHRLLTLAAPAARPEIKSSVL